MPSSLIATGFVFLFIPLHQLTRIEENKDWCRRDNLISDGLLDDAGRGLDGEEPVKELVPVPEHMREDQVASHPVTSKASPVIRFLLSFRGLKLVF